MIAAILIVKGTDDEAEHLERCLTNIKPYVDGIFLNVNHKEGEEPSQKVLSVASAYANETIITTWEDNFAKARNDNLAQVPKEYDWVIWLDTDDTLDHPEKLRDIVSNSKNYDSIYVDYEYDHDEFGNPTTVHMVARIFKNNGSHHWNPKVRIHETLTETRGVSNGMTKELRVIHHAEEERTQRSFERNIKMLEAQLEDEKSEDPRTLYYLACTYIDAGKKIEAAQMLKQYLEISGWDEERAVALTKLAQLYKELGKRDMAKQYYAMAISEDPTNPEPRVSLASLEMELEQYEKARLWLEGVLTMETRGTTLEVNPLTTTFRTYLLLADVYMKLGGKWLDKSEKYAKKALKYRKGDEKTKQFVDMIVSVNKDKKLLKGALEEYKKLKDVDEDKAINTLRSLPTHLQDLPLVAKLMMKKKKWAKNSIAIMTGESPLDYWGPWSLKDGIGGSEEAIIRIAPKLVKLGYEVTVFAKPGNDAGEYDGVKWENYWNCNLEDEFDIFIGWRSPFLFENKIKARKSYLWLHDVIEKGEFTENRVNNFTKCIVLSKYHRELFPMIPDEKILLSGNGIDTEDFEAELERDPHKIFYGSSHTRGLQYLYAIWPEVKKEVPDATLDVFYGRYSYDKINAGNPERIKWMDNMMAKAEELDGVTDHGKVGQDRLAREILTSGVWAYPCPFPEIYCITAVKAQAGGCYPVSTDHAALDEMVQFGDKIHVEDKDGLGVIDEKVLNEFKDKLIYALKHPELQEKHREEMRAWAKTLSWENTAIGWHNDFSN